MASAVPFVFCGWCERVVRCQFSDVSQELCSEVSSCSLFQWAPCEKQISPLRCEMTKVKSIVSAWVVLQNVTPTTNLGFWIGSNVFASSVLCFMASAIL